MHTHISVEVIVRARPNSILKLCNTGKMPPIHILILPWEQKFAMSEVGHVEGVGYNPPIYF